ncbi:MBL fold metallo-hydrolase [Croceicoccus sp. Ery15]|uniref:MBL fold metallo-hydrolase n=1 Tax=Croceicoccus sp. Ery15 TaxID=1703338 RepID=UPI001E32A1D8|nr:MBL fold metallo-hydrolase [Croceicoccus sp. Ery15]
MTQPIIEAFFDEPTNTISYLLGDPATRTAAVIDPVLDFDLASGEADFASAERILQFAQDHDWRIEMVLETHAHADHLSAAPFFKTKTDAWIGIGAHIRDVQRIFRPIFAMTDLQTDGSDFDRLFDDGERFAVGELTVTAMHVPGHTPADMAYLVDDTAFVGDTLFMPDYGTARADFPGGDARTLYRSIRRLLTLPDDTRLFLCHDYKAPGREDYRWETTIGEQRRSSVHVHDGVSEDEFVAMREARDAGLAVPRLLLPSIQVNIRAGRFAEAEANGVQYLRIPVKWKGARL